MKIIHEPGEAAIKEEDEDSHGSGSRPSSNTKAAESKTSSKAATKAPNGVKKDVSEQ